MSEGWFVRNQQELNALVQHCEAVLAKGETVRFTVHRDDTRTDRQNRALHKACELLGQALNDAGFDILSFPFKEGVDMPWDKESVKKRLFNPIMEAKTEKKSSTQLTKKQVSEVWDILIRHCANVTGVSISFPTWEHYYEKRDFRKLSGAASKKR